MGELKFILTDLPILVLGGAILFGLGVLVGDLANKGRDEEPE